MENKVAIQQKGMMQMICAGASRVELVRQYGTLTPERILADNVASMARLRKEHGVDTVERALAVMLLDASTAFDNALDKTSALELAAELHTVYYWLSMEDCFVVLNRIRRKPLFGKFDLNKVLVEFEVYAQERIAIAADMSFNQHLSVSDKGGNLGGKPVKVGSVASKMKRK